MSEHKLFSPSKAGMWLNCPGSMSFPENQDTADNNPSAFAHDGSITHAFGAHCLQNNCDAEPGLVINYNEVEYTLDEDRAVRVQGYLDDVRRRAIGGYLFVERFVDLTSVLGEGQGGTPDVSIVLPEKRLGIIEDLKDGSGERVYASYLVSPATDTTSEVREPNPQLALYALGSLRDWDLFGDPVEEILLVIYQPKLNVIDEFQISRRELLAFGKKAATAVELAGISMVHGPNSLTTAGYLRAGTKQCRWCRAAARCPELQAFTERETRLDFEDISSQPSIPATESSVNLGLLYAKVPLVERWCQAVKSELVKRVSGGEAILGPDGKPYKFVEGQEGKRQWADKGAAEAALVGQLGPEAYEPQKIVTAPAAEKLLKKKYGGKKKLDPIWTDLFAPLIHRPRSQPQLVFGSDPRPAFTGAGQAEDFEIGVDDEA